MYYFSKTLGLFVGICITMHTQIPRKNFTTNLELACVLEQDPAGAGRLGGGKLQARDGEEAGTEVRRVSEVERSAKLEDLHAGHLHRLTERRGR